MPNWKKVIVSGSNAVLNNITSSGNISASGDITGNSFIKSGGTSAQFLKADGSVDSTAYTTNTGTVDTTGTPLNNQLAIFTDSDTIEGDSDLTWNGSLFTINGTGSVDLLQVDDKLQGNGSGFQFFAFNEDTIKVKFANWYSSNDRQYGMGQLWYETWFAAIDNQAGRDNRRIGFYLEEPDAGSTDSGGTSNQHPSNARFYVDINGGYLSGSFQASGNITGSALQLGNLGAENEILIVGANTQVTSSNLLAIDTVNQRVGIGTSTPQVKLDLVGESSGEAQVRVAQHDDTSDGPDIRFFKSHGTAAASSSVANNDYIGAVNAFAYDGSTYIQSGFFGFQADGTDGDSKFGLRTRVGGTLTDRITIDAAGDVDVAGQLSINGFSDVSASLATIPTNNNQLTNGAGYLTTVDISSDTNLVGGTNLTLSGDTMNLDANISLTSITASGDISASGDITSNTFETISTTLTSDSATNVDTFATSTYNGAIYDYILKDSTVGARAGQFMVAHDDGDVTFTDTSTRHLSDSTIPEITADISGADVRVRVTNGNGYTFKAFAKKL
jgi:hypothetical protein